MFIFVLPIIDMRESCLVLLVSIAFSVITFDIVDEN